MVTRIKEARLKKQYREKTVKALKEEYGYSSLMQVPKLEKIVVSVGLGDAILNKKLLDSSVKELGQITGSSITLW